MPRKAARANAGAKRLQIDTKKRAAIYEALRNLMMRDLHFSEISVADIVAEADISRSTFYLHFAGKQELIEDMIDRFQDELLEASAIADDVFAFPNQEAVRLSLINLARLYRKNVTLFRAIHEAAATDFELSKRYHDMICGTVTARSDLLSTQKSKGNARQDMSDQVPLVITWMVERTISQHITAKTKAGITNDAKAMAVIDSLAEVVTRAMMP